MPVLTLRRAASAFIGQIPSSGTQVRAGPCDEALCEHLFSHLNRIAFGVEIVTFSPNPVSFFSSWVSSRTTFPSLLCSSLWPHD